MKKQRFSREIGKHIPIIAAAAIGQTILEMLMKKETKWQKFKRIIRIFYKRYIDFLLTYIFIMFLILQLFVCLLYLINLGG